MNGALVGAEDKFKSTADQLQTKQNAIQGFLARKNQIEAHERPGRARPWPAAPSPTAPASDSLGWPCRCAAGAVSGQRWKRRPMPAAMAADLSQLTVMPGPAAPQPRTAKPTKASFLESKSRFG